MQVVQATGQSTVKVSPVPSTPLPHWATTPLGGYSGPIREIFLETSEARVLLLVLWQFHRNRPDTRFTALKEDLCKMARLPKVEKNREFRDLALLMLPTATAKNRRLLIEAILAWIEEVPSAPCIGWTVRMDLSLLKLVLRSNGSLKGLVPIMRSYDPDVTLAKVRQRIPLLLSLQHQPALEMLRRSCPNWWRSMLLGDSTRIAVCILRKASSVRVKKERVEEFAESVKFLRYDGGRAIGVLATYRTTFPRECAAFLNSWPEDIGALSAGDKEMIGKTRLAIYSRHLSRLPLIKK